MNGRLRASIVTLLVGAAALLAWRSCAPTDGTRAIDETSSRPPSTTPDADARPRADRRKDAVPTTPPGDTGAPPTNDAPVAAEATKPVETFPLTVTVLRSDGAPAVHAVVVLYDEGLDADWSHEIARARTDESGVAATRPPESNLRVAAWLGAEATATRDFVEPKTTHALTLRLSPAMVVRGRVVLGDAAVAGADVELLVSPWFGNSFGLTFHATSDAAGRFEFPPFARAGVDQLNPPFVEATTKDRARGYVEVEPANAADVEVRLTPGFTARARFVDAAGKPVVATLIVIAGKRLQAVAGADGRVALRLPEGSYEFVASRDTGRSIIEDFDVEVSQSPAPGSPLLDPIVAKWACARTVGVHEEGTGDVDLGDVVLAAGKPVRGVVVDPAGAPSPRAVLTLTLGDVRVGSVAADDKGRFEFPEVADEPHKIHVRETPTDPRGTARHADIDGVQGGCADLRLALRQEFVITFRFLADGDRAPVKASGVAIKAFRHGETSTCAGFESVGGDSDFDAIAVPSAGSYDGEVTVAGFEPQRFESVQVEAGRPAEIELLLRKKRE